MSEKIKLLVTSVPWTDTESPLLAPALLKSMCVGAGIDTVAIDLNQEFINYIRNKYGEEKQARLQTFMYMGNLDFDKEVLIDGIDYLTKFILKYNPTHVALSLLTYTSQIACEWICFRLRQQDPNLKIIIGGAGVFNTLESTTNFGEKLLQQKQIDHYIKGDGDVSLPELILQGNDIKGVDGVEWQQVPNLNDQAPPDYSDYNWSLYTNHSIGVVGSRGCVRNCSFCDIHEHWKKFQWRTGEDIFKELVWHNKKTGIQKFRFQDSLINGNQVEFRKLMRLLADHNDKNPDNKLTWTSFFIFRPERQMNENDWIDISKSAELLVVGIESLNEEIRFHMGKKFTNEDMNYCLDMCKKYHIKIHMLLIVGYVLDTDATNDEAKEWFYNNKQYINNPILSVKFGGTLGILPGTELYRKQKELGIELKNEQFDHIWTIAKTNNTPKKRVKWLGEQIEACVDAGFTVVERTDNHLVMEQQIK